MPVQQMMHTILSSPPRSHFKGRGRSCTPGLLIVATKTTHSKRHTLRHLPKPNLLINTDESHPDSSCSQSQESTRDSWWRQDTADNTTKHIQPCQAHFIFIFFICFLPHGFNFSLISSSTPSASPLFSYPLSVFFFFFLLKISRTCVTPSMWCRFGIWSHLPNWNILYGNLKAYQWKLSGLFPIKEQKGMETAARQPTCLLSISSWYNQESILKWPVVPSKRQNG